MRLTFWLSIGLLALVALSACGPALSRPPADAERDATQVLASPTATEVPTPVAEASAPPSPSAIPTTPPTLLPEESPPAGAKSEFSTDFSKHSVPYSEILSGGPPKDGIPAIDDPKFVSTEEADEWLEPQEPVVLVQVGDDARAYPIQILMWHEIVNDTVGGVPVTVTFCPLCNTGVAFERTFEGQVLDFGTTGRLRFSNLVMYDRQTETWWQQATGEGIAGEFTGRQLTFVPASMISRADFKATYPDGTVLSRETGYSRNYGRNPYTGYDDVNRSPFLYVGPETPGTLPPMARVLTVDLNGEAVGYPYEVLQEVRVVNDTVGGVPIVVLWAPGTASALDAGSVAGGDDVGAATTFSRELDGQTLTFVFDGDRIVDEQTGSEWDVLGQAVSGSLAGSQLTPVVSINHFWFSWAAFRPETRVYSPDQPTSAAPSPVPESSELTSDFEITVYQGEDVLGGQSVRFSEVLALGKPVVLNMWAGLCPICRTEMPELQEAYEKYGDRVLIIGVDIGPFVGLGGKEEALALLNELGITYPAGSTSDVTVMRDYKVLGTPATYFLKPNGEIIQQWNGFLTGDQLNGHIEALLEASASS
jgi:thiol-disulfide isomerase/thioredoxin